MIDGHVHLEKGPLTKEYVYEFIKEAQNKGIDELQILDHTHRFIEFKPLYENYRFIKAQAEWVDKDLRNSLNEYVALIQEIKKEQLPIKVKFGLEVCYQQGQDELIKDILRDYRFDFLIGSIHAIDYYIYDSAWSKEELWDKFDKDYIYQNYFKHMYALVESDLFTQLGHPDTIKMFNIYPSFDQKPYYEKLAKLLNEHHMKVENNVGCFYRYHTKDCGLADEFLEIFKKHNCQMITVSDAHLPKDVGNNIKDVWHKTME